MLHLVVKESLGCLDKHLSEIKSRKHLRDLQAYLNGRHYLRILNFFQIYSQILEFKLCRLQIEFVVFGHSQDVTLDYHLVTCVQRAEHTHDGPAEPLPVVQLRYWVHSLT